KEVNNPGRFGVAEVKGDRIVSIEEKPHKPKSNYAVTGFYLYNFDVFNKIKRLKPSERGELEITDVHTMYIQEGNLSYAFIDSFWSDAGTFESLLTASNRAAERMKNSNP
ncbi:spore coat protein, partial [Patescibacteria group bacterium]|nr:spore coat protein [Patescibacteria group bacterium]